MPTPAVRTLLLMGGATAFDWYVDSVNGNDAYDGQSPDRAKATFAAVSPIRAGQRIGLARGSSWREQLTISVNNVRVQAYGSGSAPLLDCSDVVPNASFAKTGGLTNVYEIEVDPATAATKTWVNAWEDGTFLTRADDVADCDATPGSYFPSADTGTDPITLYIHASDSSDVTANGKLYEYSARQYGLTCYGASGCVIDGLRTRRNLHENGSLEIGVRGTVLNCTAEEGSKHNVYLRTGCRVVNCIADGAYNNGQPITLFVHNEGTPSNEGVSYENCTAQLDAISVSSVGFSGHNNVSGSFGAVTYTNCTAINCATGFAGLDFSTATFTGCLAEDCTFGFRADVAATLTFTGCQYKNDSATNCRAIYTNVEGATLVIDGLRVCTDVSVSGGAIHCLHNATVTLTGSTFKMTTGATRGVFTVAANKTAMLTASGNIYDGMIRVVDYPGTATLNLTSNNNTFCQTTLRNRIAGTDHTTVAAYQAATSQDADSIVGSGSGDAACT